MILIVGATGVLGRKVTAALLAQGRAVRAATREPQRAADLRRLGAEIVRADLIDPPSLARACVGVEAVFAAAHSLMGSGKYASAAVDGAAHRALIDAAKVAGVARFVYVSARGATPDHAVDFFRTKAVIEHHLRQSGIDHAVLRPSPFMEWHVHTLLGKPIVESGKAVVFGSGNARTNFAASDVARYACIALAAPGMMGRTFELGGPDNVTRRDVVAMYERHTGRTARVRYLPVALMRTFSALLRPIAPVASRLMAAAVWGETADQTFDTRVLPPDMPQPVVRVEEFVERAIAERAD